jgi:hypothetical protein
MSALRKNTPGQVLTFALVNATTGAALTGVTVTARLSVDGAAQATAGGAVAELGNGQYRFSPTAADTNGNSVGYLFTAAGALPVNVHCFTTAANPADAVAGGLTALPAAAAGAAGGLPTVNAANQVAGVSGNVAGSVGSVAAGGIAAASFAAGAVDAAALAADAAAEVADKLLGRSLQGGADGGRTVRDSLRLLRNRWTVAGTTLTIYAEDDATASHTMTVTATAGANAITGVDPA